MINIWFRIVVIPSVEGQGSDFGGRWSFLLMFCFFKLGGGYREVFIIFQAEIYMYVGQNIIYE